MKKIKALLIDHYHLYINSTNYTFPHHLSSILDLKIFGPGYVSEDDLRKGLKSFINKHNGFDVYLSTSNFAFRRGLKEWANYKNSYLFKVSYIPYNHKYFEYCHKIENDFEKLIGPKILYFINQDYYNLLDRHIEVLEKKYDYILAPNQSIFPKNNIQYLNSETFSIEYTKYKKWHSFSSNHNEKIFPLTHAVSKGEFDYSSIHHRKNDWCVPGAEYISRVTAKQKLLDRNLIKKRGRLASRFNMFLFNNFINRQFFINYYQKSFSNSLKESKFCFTCISKLEFPLKKIFEIPSHGSLLVMPENKTVKNLGFKNMKNCIFTKPENILDVNDWLRNNMDKASQIAEEGRNFVLKNHTLEQRSLDILKFLKKILVNKYKGADWINGKIVFK